VDAGLDYSSSTIPGLTIIADGFSFVLRYTDSPALNFGTKHTSPDDYAQLTAAGVRVFLVFELRTNDFAGDFLQGVSYGTRAKLGAEWVGHNGIIFAAVDTHLTPAQIPVALDYLDGFAHAVGADKLGVYGFGELIQAAQAQGLGVVYWQAGHRPDDGAGVHIWQDNTCTVHVGGVECDRNLQLLPWPEDDMTPEQEAKLDEVLGFVNALYQQSSGSMELGEWAGWESFPDGSGFSLTQTDYLRQADVQLETMLKAITSLQLELAALKARFPA
jgi:hypothetical protein